MTRSGTLSWRKENAPSGFLAGGDLVADFYYADWHGKRFCVFERRWLSGFHKARRPVLVLAEKDWNVLMEFPDVDAVPDLFAHVKETDVAQLHAFLGDLLDGK